MTYIFLDYNGATPLAPSVHEVICSTLKHHWANPGTKTPLGKLAKNAIDKARIQVASMINASPEEIIFNSGGTEAINQSIYSAVQDFPLDKGRPHAITSCVEHDATIRFLEHLQNNNKLDITEVKVDEHGGFPSEAVIEAIQPNTCLITLMFANNETGVVFPIAEIGRKLKALNQERKKTKLPQIYFHVDGAQGVGKFVVDVNDLNIDYLSIASTKFYGPRIGALYVRKGSPMYPLLHGGGQESGYRSGTQNTGMIAGLGEACELVTNNIESYRNHMMKMRDYLQDKLVDKLGNNVSVNFTKYERVPNTLSASFKGVRGSQVLENCQKVLASTGASCHSTSDQPSRILMQSLSEDVARGTIRLSVGRETTKEEVEDAAEDLSQAFNLLSKLT